MPVSLARCESAGDKREVSRVMGARVVSETLPSPTPPWPGRAVRPIPGRTDGPAIAGVISIPTSVRAAAESGGTPFLRR